MDFLLNLIVEKAYAADDFINLPTTKVPGTFEGIANRMLDILTYVAYPLAFVAMLYTVYILLTSTGKPEAMTTAKKNILNMCIGVFIISFAAIFIRFVLRIFNF